MSEIVEISLPNKRNKCIFEGCSSFWPQYGTYGLWFQNRYFHLCSKHRAIFDELKELEKMKLINSAVHWESCILKPDIIEVNTKVIYHQYPLDSAPEDIAADYFRKKGYKTYILQADSAQETRTPRFGYLYWSLGDLLHCGFFPEAYFEHYLDPSKLQDNEYIARIEDFIHKDMGYKTRLLGNRYWKGRKLDKIVDVMRDADLWDWFKSGIESVFPEQPKHSWQNRSDFFQTRGELLHAFSEVFRIIPKEKLILLILGKHLLTYPFDYDLKKSRIFVVKDDFYLGPFGGFKPGKVAVGENILFRGGGMPDLLVLKDNYDDYLFVEVKSKTDKIHESQARWFLWNNSVARLKAEIMRIKPLQRISSLTEKSIISIEWKASVTMTNIEQFIRNSYSRPNPLKPDGVRIIPREDISRLGARPNYYKRSESDFVLNGLQDCGCPLCSVNKQLPYTVEARIEGENRIVVRCKECGTTTTIDSLIPSSYR